MARYAAFLKAGSNNFQTTAEHTNAFATDFLIDGVVGAITNTSDVAPMTGAFAVNAQGTPDATVAVSVGKAYVTATPGAQASQRIRLWSDASENVTIAANATGGTRYDWIYLKVDPTNADNPALAGDNAWTFNVSRSTSSSTDNGTPPTYGLVIAVVTVANGFTTITNGNISDRRVRTGPNAFATGTSVANLYNPYKFRVYQTATFAATASAWTVIPFDTKTFDTSSNVDIVTNKGRFTAPVAGFYQFNARGNIDSSSSEVLIAFYKNGVEMSRGGFVKASTSVPGVTAGDLLQLSAGDYVDVRLYSNSTIGVYEGSNEMYFSGFLVSAT